MCLYNIFCLHWLELEQWTRFTGWIKNIDLNKLPVEYTDSWWTLIKNTSGSGRWIWFYAQAQGSQRLGSETWSSHDAIQFLWEFWYSQLLNKPWCLSEERRSGWCSAEAELRRCRRRASLSPSAKAVLHSIVFVAYWTWGACCHPYLPADFGFHSFCFVNKFCVCRRPGAKGVSTDELG